MRLRQEEVSPQSPLGHQKGPQEQVGSIQTNGYHESRSRKQLLLIYNKKYI
jgi:hypothetical protein